jgi:hypothetical protein
MGSMEVDDSSRALWSPSTDSLINSQSEPQVASLLLGSLKVVNYGFK